MHIKALFKKIISLNKSPREIALGIAIGVFIGILPLYGLHTVLMILAALIIRPANKIAIFIGTNISLPPTVPFITWAGYTLGRLMTHNNYPAFSWTMFKNFSYKNLLELYYPLFIGSLTLGLGCALLFYFTTYNILQRKDKEIRAGHA